MTEVDILMISGLLGTCVVVYGDVGTGHRVPWIFLCVSSAKHCQQQSAAQRSYPSGHTEWSASLPLSPSLFTYIHTHALTSRHSSQTTTTFCLINVSRLSTVGDRAFPVAATHLWNSLPSHVTAPPLSPSSAVVLNHISSHFLIPLSDSSLICTVTRHFGHYNRFYI